ncbi:MAG: hypothetical protein VKM92_00900, partial [Cyanobacteriota bacterium]|nr:hypothetical protein [Cyanobacteriota bacterium]
LLGELRGSQQLGQRLQQRAMAVRALALLRGEAARASRVAVGGLDGGTAACGLAGRPVLLHLVLPTGPITYTLGPPPSGIWRGAVLMRCGPAYGLDGEPSAGAAQNRVLLDGLESLGSGAERISPAGVRLTLQGRSRVAAILAAPG